MLETFSGTLRGNGFSFNRNRFSLKKTQSGRIRNEIGHMDSLQRVTRD
jgi:hypothetical protein